MAGPTVPVQIEVPPALANSFRNAGQPVPHPVNGAALIDTGATRSCVDDTVIQNLGVQPVGVAVVGTAGGQQKRSMFPGRFTFPGTPLPSIDFSQLLGVDLTGQTIAGSNVPLIALIGRDILRHFMFIYNGRLGQFTLAI